MPIDANVHHTHLAPKLQNLHKSKKKSDFLFMEINSGIEKNSTLNMIA